MARVSGNRPIERAGINAMRMLFDSHGHIVQEIDGNNDHGEDILIETVKDRVRTGHRIAVQVKAGEKYKRSNGYAIPLGNHRDDWEQSRVPVVGVVYDIERGQLYWVNLTRVLQYDKSSSWIEVPETNLLTDNTVADFVENLIEYIDSGRPHSQPTKFVNVHELSNGFVLTNCSETFLEDISIRPAPSYDEYEERNTPKSWAVITRPYISSLEPFDGVIIGHRGTDMTWTSLGPEIEVTGRDCDGREFSEHFWFFP